MTNEARQWTRTDRNLSSVICNSRLLVCEQSGHRSSKRALRRTRRADPFRRLDGGMIPVRHGYPHPRPSQHRDVIFTIAERQNLSAERLFCGDFCQGGRFVDPPRHKLQILPLSGKHIRFFAVPGRHLRSNFGQRHRVAIPNDFQSPPAV